MRHILYNSTGNVVGVDTDLALYECADDGTFSRYIEINGATALKYSQAHPADKYRQLLGLTKILQAPRRREYKVSRQMLRMCCLDADFAPEQAVSGLVDAYILGFIQVAARRFSFSPCREHPTTLARVRKLATP